MVNGTIDISVPSTVPPSAVLEVIVSNVNGSRTHGQDAISNGYEGFVRARLTKPSCMSLTDIGWTDWHFRSVYTLACLGSFAGLNWGSSAVGEWRINQSGCAVSLERPDEFPAGHAGGTVDGNVLSFSLVSGADPPSSPSPSYTGSTFDYVGTITPAYPRIDVAVNGRFTGEFRGQPGSCEVTGTEIWTPIYRPIPPQ